LESAAKKFKPAKSDAPFMVEINQNSTFNPLQNGHSLNIPTWRMLSAKLKYRSWQAYVALPSNPDSNRAIQTARRGEPAGWTNYSD
jgi:hypothetical protein